MVGEGPTPAVALPAGWTADNLARCRSCKAEVIWAVHDSGKRAPFDMDGSSHFATCPQADYWRKAR
jgi:hypothetical protein